MRKAIDKEELKDKLKELPPSEIANLLWEMGENKNKKQKRYGYFDFNNDWAYQVRVELNQVYG